MGKQIAVIPLENLQLDDGLKNKLLKNQIRILIVTKNGCECGAIIGKEELKIIVKNDT